MSSAGVLSIPTMDRATTALIRPALAGVDDAKLEAAFEHCRGVVKARARNFYYGLRLTPEPRRSAVYAIYAWMRFGDDCVDEARDIGAKQAELKRFRDSTEAILAGGMPTGDEAFWLAFAATLRSYPIDPAHIRAMVDGLAEDLTPRGYGTMDELEGYCFRVASTVGLVCVGIWGYRAGVRVDQLTAGAEMAQRRGKAFQLTNILRDFAEDFDAEPSRVYLPGALFGKHGVTPAELRSWSKPAACDALVREVWRRAQDHYDASARLDELIDPACRSTLYAMTRIYHGLLELIEKNPAAIVGGKRIRLSSRAKASIAGKAWLRDRLGLWPASGRA